MLSPQKDDIAFLDFGVAVKVSPLLIMIMLQLLYSNFGDDEERQNDSQHDKQKGN